MKLPSLSRSQPPQIDAGRTLHTIELTFHIEHDATAASQELGHKRPAATREAIVGDGEYHRVRGLKRVDAGEVNAIFAFDFAWIGKRIMHLYHQSVRAQLIDDVGDSGISGVGNIFFKTDAENRDRSSAIVALEQAADAFTRDALPDAVVDLASG